MLFQGARSRARKYGLAFDISIEDVKVPELCPVLGMRLVVNSGKCQPNSPTLDRIDSSLGYVKGNVVVISHRANTIKNDATIDELRLVLAFLADREEQRQAA